MRSKLFRRNPPLHLKLLDVKQWCDWTTQSYQRYVVPVFCRREKEEITTNFGSVNRLFIILVSCLTS